MKGDIGADLHAPEKRYAGVRAQQGRVLTDQDFNEGFDLVDDALEGLVRALICSAGSPDGGFEVSAPEPATLAMPGGTSRDTANVTVAPGHFVLGGRVLKLEVPQRFLAQDDWLSLPLDPDELPPAPVAGRQDLVYLESVIRPVRAVEDREIQERALGSADTTTRLRPQLRLRILPGMPADCRTAAEAMRALLAGAGGSFGDDGTELLSNARLSVGFLEDGPVADPCKPRSIAGYLGAENQTLKVMLTAPDRFVWAYDHGEPLYRVQVNQSAGRILFLTEPRDPVLYPRPGQVIEFLPWDMRLPNGEKAAAALGHRARLTGHYDPAAREIAYDGSLPAEWQAWLDALPAAWEGFQDSPARYFYACIWEEPAGGGTDAAVGDGVALAETGVALTFSGTGFAGDYWTVALRPDAPEIVVPWRLMAPDGAPPAGPRRFYAPLGLIDWDSRRITDCRNRFRSLCRIRGCCSYQVGDGRTSFGDMNSIQAAVDALPPEGGEICLLPGRHAGPVDLTGLRNITIHGCGRRSVLESGPDGATGPLIVLEGSRGIVLRDFVIEAEGLALAAEKGPTDFLAERLGVSVATAAVRLRGGRGVRIADCSFTARPLPVALTDGAAVLLAPLVVLRARDAVMERCEVVAASVPEGHMHKAERFDRLVPAEAGRNLRSLGGVQICGGSARVRLTGNRIRGGNGHGIALGSVVERSVGRPDAPERDERPFERFRSRDLHAGPGIDDDGCLKFKPDRGFTIPGVTPEATLRESEGALRDLLIENNHIADHGGSGISVAHWFIPLPDAKAEALDDIEIEEVAITGNTIEHCVQLDLAGALPVAAAFASAFGGVTLAHAAQLRLADNEIRFCGTAGRTAICGIYIRHGEELRITDNRIRDNGRPSSLTDLLLVGSIGGIVLAHVEGREDNFATGLRQTPALVLRGNTVVAPEGRALHVAGSGQMVVEGNTLTTHGNNSLMVILMALFFALDRGAAAGSSLTGAAASDGADALAGQVQALFSQLAGSAVSILNTGLNPNIAAFAASFLGLRAMGESAAHGKLTARERIGLADLPPQGPVMFSDNQVVFDASGEAMTLSLCAVGILTLDDVGMHDNQCMVDALQDLVLINAMVLSLVSARVQGNRFREIVNLAFAADDDTGDGGVALPFSTVFSAVVLAGFLNATEMNQGTHCFLKAGGKMPQLLPPSFGSEMPRLDTNRHLAPDFACDRLTTLLRG